MPIRLCSVSTCSREVHHKGRCAEHFREREQRWRPGGYATYRSKRWRMLARRVKFEQPLCPGLPGEECGAIATEVDHIVAMAAGGQPFARANLQALCASCHARKTRAERAAGTAQQGSG